MVTRDVELSWQRGVSSCHGNEGFIVVMVTRDLELSW